MDKNRIATLTKNMSAANSGLAKVVVQYLIVGNKVHIDMDASLVEKDGFVALSDADILISQGLDAYFVSKAIGCLPYAKP